MVGIYVRQSLEKKESISIESQIEYGKFEACNNKYKIYSDKGFSGKNTNRPAYKELIKDAKTGILSKVVVYRLDRISRSLVDFADFINILESNSISFVSATEKFDTSTPVGRAMLYIVVVFAQLERETIASRVQDNYFSRVKKGELGGGLPPFGYKLKKINHNNRNINILEDTQKLSIVKEIFRLYGTTYASLSNIQTTLLTLAPYEKFTTSKISKILKNPIYVKCDYKIYDFYKNPNNTNKEILISNTFDDFTTYQNNGCILIGRNSNKNHMLSIAHHKGVIDSELFITCQNKLQKNKQISNKSKSKYWLTGLLKCGYCNYNFSIKSATTKSEKVFYLSCNGKYIHKTCTQKQTHRLLDIESIVEEELLKYISTIKIPIGLFENNIQQIENIDLEINKLHSKIDILLENIDTKNSNDISNKYIKNKIEEYHKKQELLINTKNNISNSNNNKYTTFTKVNWDSLCIEDKHSLATKIIKDITVTKNHIHIDFF